MSEPEIVPCVQPQYWAQNPELGNVRRSQNKVQGVGVLRWRALLMALETMLFTLSR